MTQGHLDGVVREGCLPERPFLQLPLGESFGAAGSRDLGHARFSGSPGREQSVSPGTQHNVVSSWLRTVLATQDRHTVGPQRRASGGIHVQTVGTFFLWEDHPERPTSSHPRAVVKPRDAQ